MQLFLQMIELQDDNDTWKYSRGTSFYVAKAYKLFQGPAATPTSFKWLWDLCYQNKHKIFYWDHLHISLNTMELLPT
jgi:hypothetical protein